ncbi:MAG: prepilin-type N-terminal cleavage/methylation domain-containing protein [Phycisphaerae bacterium]|nr:prepilin-type N-terminal cleavage/methylation domain-containing protein [Phycisphaerae bacterium]
MNTTQRLVARVSARRGSAFTLVELLIVIMIIVILMTMIGVVAPRIQERIDQTKCQKNLKTIHQILMAYTERNDGWFPLFSSSGLSIQHAYNWPADASRPKQGLWEAMSDIVQLKELGGSAEVFFCPLHPDYGDYENWAFNSWEEPHAEHNSWSNYDYYETNMGYYTTINKSIYSTSNRLTDGRIILRKAQGGSDDMPIFADIVRLKTGSATDPYGWYHGDDSDDVDDRAYKGGGNTLFFGGYVVWAEWAALDEQATHAELGCGATDTSSHSYYFWLGYDLSEEEK